MPAQLNRGTGRNAGDVTGDVLAEYDHGRRGDLQTGAWLRTSTPSRPRGLSRSTRQFQALAGYV
jgi:hypothetical protein